MSQIEVLMTVSLSGIHKAVNKHADMQAVT